MRDTDSGVSSSVSGGGGSIFGSTPNAARRRIMIINNHLYKIKLSLRFFSDNYVSSESKNGGK